MEKEHRSLQAQIKSILRDEIARGVWPAGSKIPTEPELMQRFSVSRITVSQALKDLVKEGLIVRRQGRGTFVSAHQNGWVNLGGLLQRMPVNSGELAHGRGHFELVAPPLEVQMDLQLSSGEKTWRFTRIKLNGEAAVGWEQAFIPESLVPEEPSPDVNWDQLLFVAILTRLTGHRARRCRAFLQAIIVGQDLSEALGESTGRPAIEVARLWHNDLGLPVLLTRSVLRTVGARYFVDLPDLELEEGEEERP